MDYGLVYPEDINTAYLRQHYSAWLDSGNQGAMQYIDRRLDILCDPFGTRPNAKCALVIAFAPKPDLHSPLLELPQPQGDNAISASIAGYAMEEDYHITGLRILERISQELDVWSESCVDAKPVPEKEFAGIARIGEKGLNTLMRLPGLGCRLNLGVLFLGRRYEQKTVKPHSTEDCCCACGRCVSLCPNGALDGHGSINVRRCRSWLSGQKRGALTKDEQLALRGALFGCSVCSTCCPDDNVKIPDRNVDALAVFNMPAAQLRRIITGTALEHSGTTLLKRNAAAALCCARPELAPILLKNTDSPAIQETIGEWF